MPSRTRRRKRENSHRPSSEGTFHVDTPETPLIDRWIEAKIRLEVLVLDDDAKSVVEAIAKHARTETIGDGKIWVTPVDGAMRVRTGARDRDAV